MVLGFLLSLSFKVKGDGNVMCASEPNRCMIPMAAVTGGRLDASSVQTAPHLTLTTTSEGGFFVLLEAKNGAYAAYLGGGSKNCQQEGGKDTGKGEGPIRVGVPKQLRAGGTWSWTPLGHPESQDRARTQDSPT